MRLAGLIRAYMMQGETPFIYPSSVSLIYPSLVPVLSIASILIPKVKTIESYHRAPPTSSPTM
jgi:hypothetical protein